MNIAAQIFEQHLITIYFFYGLAFFSMGLALLVETGRSSEFPFAEAMAPLAAFGIIHGFHEWLEMFQLLEISGAAAVPDWLLSDGLRLFILVVSFALLVVFGVRLVYANHRPEVDGRLEAAAAALILIVVWAISVLAARQIYSLSGSELAATADVLGRYILAIPGALLAAWAIILEQRTFSARGMSGFGRALFGAAVALIIYGTIGQLFTKTSPIFPSNVINSELFLSLFGLPVQLLRALCAIIMTLFIIRALRFFDTETEQQLMEAREAQASAQQAILYDQQNIEQLNRELRDAVGNLSSLFGFAQSLAKTLDSKEMLQDALVRFVSSEPHFDACIVFLRDKPHEAPYIAAMTRCPANQEVHDTMFEHALLIGDFVTNSEKPGIWTGTEVKTITDEYQFEPGQNEGPPVNSTGGRTLGVPLNIRGQYSGSLVICTVPEKPPFSAREFSLVSTAAEQLSIALQNAALYQELQERDKLRGELLHQVVSAQETERQRIARELHDGTGQTLTALGLGLAAVSGRISEFDHKTSEQVNELKNLSTSAMIELRDVISNLRPSLLDDLGLVPALRGQVQTFIERSGIHAELHVKGTIRRLSPDLETIVYRIIQEALTNISKHANAASCDVLLLFEIDELQIIISDDGRGFDVDEILRSMTGELRAWGLLGMQERVALAGGTFDITSAPGEGTLIQISIPLREEAVEKEIEEKV
ncbi:MAG: histidine kinase [Candidatus Promineifilaceae bacterium]